MLPIWNSDLNAWGFVDESGRLAVPYEWQFDSFDTPHFDSGHCLVAKYEKSPAGISYKRWYIIDKQGRSVKLPANIEKVSNFQNGIASVVSKKGNVIELDQCRNPVFHKYERRPCFSKPQQDNHVGLRHS